MDDADSNPGKREMYGTEAPEPPMSLEEIERRLTRIDKNTKAECVCFSKRCTIALMACLGIIILFGMRTNMAMAKLSLSHEEYTNGTSFGEPNIRHEWSFAMQSALDTSFFWGYLLSQVPGGFLAYKYPATKIFGTAVAFSAFLNFLIPFAFGAPLMVIGLHLLQGLFAGATFPAVQGIWRFWAPSLERSRLATIVLAGCYAGILVGTPTSAILTSWISWKAAFYFYGLLGLVWFAFWLWISSEKPRYHPTISKQELKYIEKSLGASAKLDMPKIPWREMFRSMPVYAILVTNFCRSWNFYLLVLYQSKFLRFKFFFQIADTGILRALPIVLMTVIVPFGGVLADCLRKRRIMTTTNVRKLFNCGGFGVEGLLFLCVAFATTGSGSVAALTSGVVFSGLAVSGYQVNYLDVAPRFASILFGISNVIGSTAGLLCPIVVDYITRDPTDKSCWRTVFIIAACFHLVSVVFYGIFASGELQPWAEPTLSEDQTENDEESSDGQNDSVRTLSEQ